MYVESSGRFDVVPFQRRVRTPISEIYPGHSLRRLGVPDYKRLPKKAIDAVLLHAKHAGVEINVANSVRVVCETYNSGGAATTDFDAADALVATVLGVLSLQGATHELLGPFPSQRSREGAIWSL